MATIAAPGTIKKETTYTEILPNGEENRRGKRKWPPMWDFIATVTPKEWQDHEIELRLYRYHPQTEKKIAVEKIFEPVDVFWVKNKYGGGTWNMMVAKNSELIINEDFMTDGPPKTAEEITASTNSNPSVEMLRTAMNPDVMRSMIQLIVNAATESMQMIRQQMPTPQNPLETLRTAKEILGPSAPPVDPFAHMISMLTIFKEIGVIGSPEKKGITEILEIVNTLKGSGLLAGAVKPDLTTTLVANLPMIADRVVSGLHEFRVATEANERTTRMQHGQMRPSDPNVITVNPTPVAATAANPVAAQGAIPPVQPAAPPPVTPSGEIQITPEVAQNIIMQADLTRLVSAMKDPGCTGRDIYDFLWHVWPAALEELGKFDKDTLVAFFQSREMQMTKFGNAILFEMASDPRLPRLIEEFLAVAKAQATPPAGTV